MLLSAVYIRFYKSFNFDYFRKYDRKRVTPPPRSRPESRAS